MKQVVSYLAVAVPFWVLDAIWLGFVAKAFYRNALGALMARKIKPVPAALFYVCYPLGLVLFAVTPALLLGMTWAHAGMVGAAFGAFCYGTYDLVNQATLEGWPWRLTVVDMAWGCFASGVATAVAAAWLTM
jgi:uncharacterized membrane protein